jgi:protease-4
MTQPREIARRVGGNLSRAARRTLARTTLPRGPGVWVVVRLAPFLEELPPSHFALARATGQCLFEVLETLDSVAADPRIDGVLLRFAGSPGGWSKVQSLRRALLSVRERGKPVAAYAEGLDAAGLLVASAATRLWVPESAGVNLLGLRMEAIFLRGLLDHLDVRPEVVRIGSHKVAGERLTRENMSTEEREQLETLVDDLYAELVDAIATGRGLDPALVRDLIDRGPYHARAAAAAGLIDGCLYPDEIESELEALTPVPGADRDGPRRVRLVEAPVYHALCVRDGGWRPLLRGLPRVAYVVARGGIHRGGGPRGIACDSVRGLLDHLGRDREVRGLVLRLDSPGGDGTASDLLWRAVSVVTREKPVVVSMGDVVASGGYYVAAAADALFAEAGTVTGSIGVVGGKLNLEGLYQRIGVGRDAVERGARAGLLSEARGFTADERTAVREGMSALYRRFVERVARARGLEEEAVDRVAQGRVWSGARALSLGLVDAIGGPLEALREARRLAGLRDEERVLVDLHPRRPHFPGLRALLQPLPRRIE